MRNRYLINGVQVPPGCPLAAEIERITVASSDVVEALRTWIPFALPGQQLARAGRSTDTWAVPCEDEDAPGGVRTVEFPGEVTTWNIGTIQAARTVRQADLHGPETASTDIGGDR